MPNSQIHVLEHRIGTDNVLTYTVRDADGAVVDLDTGEVALAISIRDYPGGTELASGSDLVSVAGTAAGVLTITINEDDLLTLLPGDYALTITRTVTVDEVTTVNQYPVSGPLILRLLPRGD